MAHDVVFMDHHAGSGPFSVWACDTDGANLVELVPNTDESNSFQNPAWNHDGTKLLYSDDVDTTVQEALADGTGSHSVHGSNSRGFSYSPDGTKILVNDFPAVVVDASDFSVLWTDGTGHDIPLSSRAWDADSSRFVVAHSAGEVVRYDADGTGRVELTDGTGDDWSPTWSPDGAKIAFVRYTGTPGIYTMNPDGTGVVLLYASDEPGRLCWADDDFVYFDNATGIARVSSAGTGFLQLTESGSEPSVRTGVTAIVPTAIQGLEWHVTGLWYPDAESVTYYGRIADPQDGSVRIPRNDSRTAQVTVSVNDPIVADLNGHTYARLLKVYYNGDLVFWGPVKLNEIDLDAGTVTLNAVDPSLRLLRHYIRRGDIGGDLGADTQDRATVTIDHLGLRTIRDAGLNTTGQTTRGVPDLGIADGTNDFVAAPDDLMGVARGDQAWEMMLQLSQSLGPDFELEPVEGTPGVYCNLNTFASQGTDKSSGTNAVVFHYGTVKDNLDNLAFTEGARYTTHVQVLDRESTYRKTPANLATSADTGPYVDWDVTEFDARNVPQADAEAVLLAYGRDVLRAYSVPLIVCTLTLPVETDTAFRYLADFILGDIVGIAGKAGHITLPQADYRINVVTLKQDGPENATRTELEVVASHVSDTDDEE